MIICHGCSSQVNDYINFFAGSKRVHSTLKRAGYAGGWYDKTGDNVMMNMCKLGGQAVALIMVLSVITGGMICGPEHINYTARV